jgi:hypothetical protein
MINALNLRQNDIKPSDPFDLLRGLGELDMNSKVKEEGVKENKNDNESVWEKV